MSRHVLGPEGRRWMHVAVALGVLAVFLLLVEPLLGLTMLAVATLLAAVALRRGGWSWSSTSGVMGASALAGVGVGFLMLLALYLVAVVAD